MSELKPVKNQKWVLQQIKQYSALNPKYQEYAKLLKCVLGNAVRAVTPFHFIQAREKAIHSFAGKILRNAGMYSDAVKEMTDLCGARVIVQTQEQVKAVCNYIEQTFVIDEENSSDVSKRLKASEFGYRSIHYIVQLKEGLKSIFDVNCKIPKYLYGLKAEIQVRTLLEHSWADFAHDTIYKSKFPVPEKWHREEAALAAMLEQVDKHFAHIIENLKRYSTNYGTYMTPAQIEEEINRLEFILKYDNDNIYLVNQLGQMKSTIGDYRGAIKVLSQYDRAGYPPILRSLGTALTTCYPKESVKYKKGLKYLNAAIKQNDADSIGILASITKSEKPNREIRSLYKKAYAASPSNPTYLANYLEYEIICQKSISITDLLRPGILDALTKLRDHADVKLNLPRTFFDMGKLYLLIGKPYESLRAYSSALYLCTTKDSKNILLDHLNTIKKLKVVKDEIEGYEWIYRLLLIGSYVRFPSESVKKELMRLATKKTKKITGPVSILAGGCDLSVDGKIRHYCVTALRAFEQFHGTVISGGTTIGISKVASELSKKYGSAVCTIGYVPKRISSKTSSNFDQKKFNEIRRTAGEGFSPLEPLQYWIDLLSAGVNVDSVRLLGINGGQISASEYRIALCLGAVVGIIQNSGRAADELFEDKDWQRVPNLLCLPEDVMTLRVFIEPPVLPIKNKDVRETLACQIHIEYREEQLKKLVQKQSELAEWKNIKSFLMDSNRKQADHIMDKLRLIGCTAERVKGREPSVMTFTKDEIEFLSELEHGRWNIERLLDGWKWGPKKDVANKISPYLISWNEVPDDIKEYDRNTVKKIPMHLAKIGLEIKRD